VINYLNYEFPIKISWSLFIHFISILFLMYIHKILDSNPNLNTTCNRFKFMNWCFIACPTKDCASMIHLSFYILFSHPKEINSIFNYACSFIVIIFPWYRSNCSHISIFQLDVRYTLMNNWIYMPITTFPQGNEGYDLLKYRHNEMDFSKFELWWHETIFCFKAK
jgi:hypothetical protein